MKTLSGQPLSGDSSQVPVHNADGSRTIPECKHPSLETNASEGQACEFKNNLKIFARTAESMSEPVWGFRKITLRGQDDYYGQGATLYGSKNWSETGARTPEQTVLGAPT